MSGIKPFSFVPIENKAIYKRYEDIIKLTNEGYSNADDEETRAFTKLDPFRHEDYPDDVQVHIQNHELRKQELIWARLKQYVGVSKENISVFIATLLDEPFADIYDMHHNDEILVGLIDQVDEPYLLGLPYKKWVLTKDKLIPHRLIFFFEKTRFLGAYPVDLYTK